MTVIVSSRLLYLAAAVVASSLVLLIFPSAALLPLVAGVLLAGASLFDFVLTPRPKVLEVTRLAPDRFAVQADHEIAVRIRNRSPLSLLVRLRDAVPLSFRCEPEEASVVVPAEAEARATYTVRPLVRGKFSWGDLSIAFRSVLGLWEMRTVIACSFDARVYPNLGALQRHHLLAQANRLESIGAHRIRRPGGQWEFEALRDYADGDDLRKIDWKATARRSRLIVRNMQAERNQTILLLIDCGRLMTAEIDGVSKLDHAVNAALILGHIALSRGDRVGLCAFSHKAHRWVPPRGHLAQHRLLTEAVFDVNGDFTETSYSRSLSYVRARHSKRALLVVFTDFVDSQTASDMLAHMQLAARHHLILFVAFNDPFLRSAARSQPATPREGFRKVAAMELLHERQEVLETLRQMGAHVIDTAPSAVIAPLVNRYLEIAFRALL